MLPLGKYNERLFSQCFRKYFTLFQNSSHLENITRTRNPVTNIANDLKHIDSKLTHIAQTSKKSPNQTIQESNPTTSSALVDSTTDNKNANPFETLVNKEHDEDDVDSNEKNEIQTESLNEDERKKQEEIRQRRLKHFEIQQ